MSVSPTHSHLHTSLSRKFQIALKEIPVAKGQPDDFFASSISSQDMDVIIDTPEPFAKCSKYGLRTLTFTVREIAKLAALSPLHAKRLSQILPNHPEVMTLIARLVDDQTTYALSSRASLIIPLLLHKRHKCFPSIFPRPSRPTFLSSKDDLRHSSWSHSPAASHTRQSRCPRDLFCRRVGDRTSADTSQQRVPLKWTSWMYCTDHPFCPACRQGVDEV